MPEVTVQLDDAWVRSVTEGWMQSFADAWWLYAIGLGLLIISGNLFRSSTEDSSILDWFFDNDADGDGGD